MGRQQQKNLLSLLVLFLLLAVLLVYAEFGSSAYFQRIVVGLGISIILVISLNLSNGLTGVFSLGHVGFMAIGAYAAAVLTLPISLKEVNLPDLPGWLAKVELSFLPATLIGGLLAIVVAFLVGLSLMRLSGPYVSVATMGFLVIVQVILINWDVMTRGSRTFSGVPALTDQWWVWGWVIGVVYVVWRLKNSSFGRRMMAGRDDEIAARSLGISVYHSRLFAFCVSAFFTAVGGALWAHFIMSFSPKSFYFAETFNVITMLVIGGMGSVSGSIIGVVSITALSEILRNAERGLNLGFIQIPPVYGASQILIAIIFILVIIYRPTGLMGSNEISFNRLWSRLLSNKLDKKGKEV
jgi:branched-chain amino acid transport system permease protein